MGTVIRGVQVDVDLESIVDPEVRFRCAWYVKHIEQSWFKRFGIIHMQITDWIDKNHYTAIYPPTAEWPVPSYGDSTPDMAGMHLSCEERIQLVTALNGHLFLSDVAPPFTLVYDDEQDTFIYAEPNRFNKLYADYLSQGEPHKRSSLKPRSIR